jgi:hypothetical protein
MCHAVPCDMWSRLFLKSFNGVKQIKYSEFERHAHKH